MRRSITIAAAALMLVIGAGPTRAQVPETMSYQGVLSDGAGFIPNGMYDLNFRIYRAGSGVPVWTEMHSAVQITRGEFNVILGASPSNPNPLSIPFDQPYWLAVSVNGGPELSSVPLAASPYSLMARTLQLPFAADFSGPNEGFAIHGSGPGRVIWATTNSSALNAVAVRGDATSAGANGVAVGGNHFGTGFAVYGNAPNGGTGVAGNSSTGTGVYGTSGSGNAGFFQGNVSVIGSLNVSGGTKNFKIDHPLDPANRYLSHTCVESPEMSTLYGGNTVLNANGEAVVTMPDWFESLNGDLRYQLTPIGAPAPGLYIAEKMKHDRFKIAGGAPGLEVSWQVTGVRHDPSAQAHPIVVEEQKAARDRGHYLDPVAYGISKRKGIGWAVVPSQLKPAAPGRVEPAAHSRAQLAEQPAPRKSAASSGGMR